MNPNPTCPHCQAPMQAVAALPFAGGLAILLECEYRHQSVKWLPRSRFIEPKQPFDASPLMIMALIIAPPILVNLLA